MQLLIQLALDRAEDICQILLLQRAGKWMHPIRIVRHRVVAAPIEQPAVACQQGRADANWAGQHFAPEVLGDWLIAEIGSEKDAIACERQRELERFSSCPPFFHPAHRAIEQLYTKALLSVSPGGFDKRFDQGIDASR